MYTDFLITLSVVEVTDSRTFAARKNSLAGSRFGFFKRAAAEYCWPLAFNDEYKVLDKGVVLFHEPTICHCQITLCKLKYFLPAKFGPIDCCKISAGCLELVSTRQTRLSEKDRMYPWLTIHHQD